MAKRTSVRGQPSDTPEPQWYLEQFRSHIGMIHQLFKACPPQQWKTLSLAIADALAEVGERIGLKVDRYIQPKGMSQKEKRFGKR
jgi:hypothetical protein